jgi:hypothetical protein
MSIARAALLFATALTCAAADHVPFELFPPKTKMVIGMSLRAIVDSQLLPMAGGTAVLPALPSGTIDPRELDSIIIASEGGTSDSPSIAVVRGRFHLDLTKAARHDGIPILQDSKGALALLDNDTAVAGPLAEVKAAIERRGTGSTISSDLAARVAAVAPGYDFWAVGDVPAGAAKTPGAKGMDAVERFDIGVALRHGLQLRGTVGLRSTEDAAQLAAMVKMFGSMFVQAGPSKSGARFDLRADGKIITLDLSIPEAEWKQAIASQRNVLTGMLQGGMPAALARPTASAAAGPSPMAAGAPAASSPARIPLSFTPIEPATIVTNDRGETVSLTLPGGK